MHSYRYLVCRLYVYHTYMYSILKWRSPSNTTPIMRYRRSSLFATTTHWRDIARGTLFFRKAILDRKQVFHNTLTNFCCKHIWDSRSRHFRNSIHTLLTPAVRYNDKEQSSPKNVEHFDDARFQSIHGMFRSWNDQLCHAYGRTWKGKKQTSWLQVQIQIEIEGQQKYHSR
jgi:hypothetical protein